MSDPRRTGGQPAPPPAPSLDEQIRNWFRKQHGVEPSRTLVRALRGLTTADRLAKAAMERVPAEPKQDRASLLRAAVRVALLTDDGSGVGFAEGEARRLNDDRELPAILEEAKRVFGE